MASKQSSYRILDANLNRASEGLRVAEDVCRFHWNLPGLARELKELRHALLEAGSAVGASRRSLLEARDTEGDVGRVTASTNVQALPLPEVASRNIQRVREAMRAIEETCRSVRPALVERFEALRYQLYSVEKGLGFLADIRDRAKELEQARLYLLVTQALCRKPVEETVEEALEAGVDMIQLREKNLTDRELIRHARRLREITARAGSLFVVNDRPDIALLAHADGLHLGQHDMPLHEARTVVGRELVIGISTHCLADARRALREGADYVGVGPMFETSTKNAGPLLGPEGLRSILPEISVPAFAIGGIREGNLEQIIETGGVRVAVSSSILSSEDVAGTVRRFLRKM